ncbi:MAG TPA: TIGR03435 family protein [Vicinamibacterales bacterium]|nr:TIGR03435 family protein [Vicinamibacterales bacterium]
MAVATPPIRRTSPLSRRLVVVALGLMALGGVAAQTQTPATTNVTFEVASIRRNPQAEQERAAVPVYVPVVPGRAQTLPGGLLRGRGMSVRELIRDAYGYRNRAHSEVVGAPGWVDNERYDVEARARQEFPGSTRAGLPPAAESALRVLLADRFKLKVRTETQRRPVYELVMHRADRRLGPNLVPSKGGCRSFFQREPVNTAIIVLDPKDGEPQPLRPCPLGVGATAIFAENMPMSDWVKILGLRPQLNRTVIDRTGLTGGFDITLQYPFEDLGAGNPLPAIKPLLEAQLGLTLRDAEGPVEILVVESIEHPTEN